MASSVVIWNTHNADYRNRGTSRCNLVLLRGAREVWKKADLLLKWDGFVDPKTVLLLPNVRFDRLRVDVVDVIGKSGGLSEIQVFDGVAHNIAFGRLVTASSVLIGKLDRNYFSKNVVDGITQSNIPGKGYWLLPDEVKAGWIEIDFRR